MYSKVYLKKGVHFVRQEKNFALVYAFGNRHIFRGTPLVLELKKIFALLQTPITAQQLAEQFSPQFSDQEISDFLAELKKAGFLQVISSDEDHSDILSLAGRDYQNFFFLNHFFKTSHSLNEIKSGKNKKIGVINLDTLGPSLLRNMDLLSIDQIFYFDSNAVSWRDIHTDPIFFKQEHLGLERIEILKQSSAFTKIRFFPIVYDKLIEMDCLVVLASWMDQEKVRELNVHFHKHQKKWFLVMQDIFGGWLGPWFGTVDGPCFECMYQRRIGHYNNGEQHKHFESYLEHNKEALGPNFSVYSQAMSALVCNELFFWLYSAQVSTLIRGSKEIDLLNLRFQFNELYPVPYCKVCSDILTVPTRPDGLRQGL